MCFQCTSVFCSPHHIPHRAKILFIAWNLSWCIIVRIVCSVSCATRPFLKFAQCCCSNSGERSALCLGTRSDQIHLTAMASHHITACVKKCKCRALHSRSAVSRIRRDPQIIFSVGARNSTLKLFFFLPLSFILSLLKVGHTCIQSEPVGRFMAQTAPAVQSPAAAPHGNHAALMAER